MGIIAIALNAPLFIKNEYVVKREIIINKPQEEVFNYIKYLKNQDNFSVWATMDPDMKKDYKGTDATVGFVSSWESKREDVGKGEQEIIAIKEGERVDYELRFIEPFEAKDHAYISTESVGANQTKVTWGFDGKMKYPFNAMLVIMDMDKMLGDQLMQGLNNLKTVLEKQ